MLFNEFDLLHNNYLKVFPGPIEGQKFINLVEPLSRAQANDMNVGVSSVFAFVRTLYNLPQSTKQNPNQRVVDSEQEPEREQPHAEL
eukprot:m.194725 g.194725  ORF g.194725 m.194725 type:complete len:87 (+) comp13661_c0_seq2:110-370(+)